MTDDELEQRLRAHYREIDPGVSRRGMGVRIDGALDRRRGRSVSLLGCGRRSLRALPRS